MFREFRSDGWPLCPVCEEDELYSPLMWTEDLDRPTLSEFMDGPLHCLRCGWDKPARQ